MRTMHGSRWTLAIGLIVAWPLLSGGSCKIKPEITDPTTQAVNILGDAIDALQSASADWQRVLADAQGKLTADVQSTIRNELANLASRSIAQAGVELRCNADFVRARVRQALIGIRSRLLGQQPPAIEPALCQVVPLAVERALVPARVTQLEFYGYDFDLDPSLRVWMERTGAPRLDVTTKLDRPTHYAMTLKFGANGVQLDAASERFVLEWEGRAISTVAVIQPATPVCATQVAQLDGLTITYRPPRTGSGDADFHGNGPSVSSSVALVPSGSLLQVRAQMRARETKADWTEASGQQYFELYRPPTGWAIERLPGATYAAHSYVDSNHTLDSFELGGGLVKRIVYTGDTDGDEAGKRTQMTVTFNRIPVELRQVGNCVSALAVQSLQSLNLLSATSLQRLQPRALQEVAKVNAALQAP